MDMPAFEFTASERAMARSRMYLLMADGFSYPSRELYSAVASGAYAASIAAMLGASMLTVSAADAASVETSLRTSTSFESFQASYLAAFETNMPTPSASLYEGSYVSKTDRAALLLEIKAFYRNFGLGMANEVNDLEDTLTAELEFMQFLAAKEAQAGESGESAAGYIRAQRDFLQRHLARWMPAFADAVNTKVDEPFFVSLSQLTNGFVAADLCELQRRTASSQ